MIHEYTSVNNLDSSVIASAGAINNTLDINTLRTGAFKLFKCTFPGFKQYKSTFILCFFKNV